jgi:hypothetical protein
VKVESSFLKSRTIYLFLKGVRVSVSADSLAQAIMVFLTIQ